MVFLDISLPEFVNDVILGKHFMKSIGLDIQFSTGSVKWLDTIVDMKHISMYDHIKQDISDIGIQSNCREAMFTWMQYQEDILFDEVEGMFPHFDKINSNLLDEFEAFTTEITGRKYQAVSTEEVIAQQDQLSAEQKQKLKSVLDKHTVLFDRKLGCYTGDKVHLELTDNYTPSWKRAYPVPFTKEKVFKDELDLMEDEGTISQIFKPS